MSDPLISIEHNGSTHARKASEWIALSRAALASPAAKIEEPDLIAEMREDAQDGRTTNKTVLDYIDSLRAALGEEIERYHSTLLHLHHAVKAVSQEFDKPVTEANVMTWLALNQAQEMAAGILHGDQARSMTDERVMTQEPSCNGSQQESQKLTGDAAGETPRTDAAEFDWSIIQGREYKTKRVVSAGFARQLERESSSLKAQLAQSEKRAMEYVAINERQAIRFAECEAQLEGFRKDAERYRFIRDYATPSSPGGWAHYVGDWAEVGMDAAIDSALHQESLLPSSSGR
jgi:hypothetical protein